MSGSQAPKQIPDQQFVSVDYPGNVQNIDRAVETLGGLPTLGKAFKTNDRFLGLQFRPNNPQSHPIFGDRIDSSRLLLTVRTSKSTGLYEAEIVGKITTSFMFQGLADFQYGLNEKPTDNEDHLEPNQRSFMMPTNYSMTSAPPIFSRIDYPMTYAFRPNPAFKRQEGEDGIVTFVPTRSRDKKKQWTVSCKDKELPTASAHSIVKTKLDVYKRVQALFNQRPIWTRAAILLNIPQNMQHPSIFQQVLPTLAYFFVDGPWRLCWVKLGYDPRKHNDAKIYQTIDFRIPKKAKKKQLIGSSQARLTKKKATSLPMRNDIYQKPVPSPGQIEGTETAAKPKKKVSTSQTTYAQLLDLKSDRFSRLIIEATSNEYNTETGWLTKKGLKSVRKAIKGCILQLQATHPNTPIDAQLLSGVMNDEEAEISSLESLDEPSEEADESEMSSEETSSEGSGSEPSGEEDGEGSDEGELGGDARNPVRNEFGDDALEYEGSSGSDDDNPRAAAIESARGLIETEMESDEELSSQKSDDLEESDVDEEEMEDPKAAALRMAREMVETGMESD